MSLKSECCQEAQSPQYHSAKGSSLLLAGACTVTPEHVKRVIGVYFGRAVCLAVLSPCVASAWLIAPMHMMVQILPECLPQSALKTISACHRSANEASSAWRSVCKRSDPGQSVAPHQRRLQGQGRVVTWPMLMTACNSSHCCDLGASPST